MPEWIGRELKPMISDLLSRRAIERRGIFRPAVVEGLLRGHFEGRRDNGLKIWGLLMLELWYRMYIDRKAVSSSESQAKNLAENLTAV
jgi:asparagine synthase (glutamine-hydrolysing)